MDPFMKGDTFLEVATCLARTDPSHPPSAVQALEVVKRYVRAKIKKGKGKQVAGPGGKLEQLEVKYARLGFVDTFYLARLELSLPPSSISLPRPSSPVRRILVKAKYPLPPAYQLPLESESHSATLSPGGIQRGRSGEIKPLSNAASTSSLDLSNSTRQNQSGRSSSRQPPQPNPVTITGHEAPGLAAIPVPVPVPASVPVTGPVRREISSRDHFDHFDSPPSATGPAAVPASTRPPQPRRHFSDQANRTDERERLVSGDEAEVRRMLQARIDALQMALHSLEVDSVIPIPQETRNIVAQETRNVVPQETTRRVVPAPTPPPTIPLPPIPSPPSSLTRTFSAPQNASFPTSSSPTIRTSPTNAPSVRAAYRARNSAASQNHPSRVNSLTKRPLPPSPTTSSTSTSSVMFDLDPDPFAAPPLPETISISTQSQTQAQAQTRGGQGPYSYSRHPTLTRLERQHAAWKRSREDLGRVQMVIGEAEGRGHTPPPMYSIEFESEDSGRAI